MHGSLSHSILTQGRPVLERKQGIHFTFIELVLYLIANLGIVLNLTVNFVSVLRGCET